MDTLGSDWDDMELTPVGHTPDKQGASKQVPEKSGNDVADPPTDEGDLGSGWDDLELTPVNRASDANDAPDAVSAESKCDLDDSRLKKIEDEILSGIKELDESFMYLGVLKKLSLPEAMGFFAKKMQHIHVLFGDIWTNQGFPEKETLFSKIDEDYVKMTRLIHSGDAINPIYNNLKSIYENIETLRSAGMDHNHALSLIDRLFTNRKS
jgi:hypothetical protein